MLEIRLVDRVEDGRAIETEYEVGCYEVEERKYKDTDHVILRVRLKSEYEFGEESYMPSIYYASPKDEGKGKFEIQTTAYGYLEPEKIHKVIAGYQTALETVAVLEKAFLK